jgi:hypothetical protein
MRKTTTQYAVVMAIFTAFGGCSHVDDSTDSSPFPEAVVAQEPSSGIVFRGRYFLSKECRQLGGAYALGMWGVCEVDEVIEGDLKLKLLKDVRVPADVVEGMIYTFRWKISDSDREHLRKAQDAGFTGMWLDCETLELVRDGEPNR